MSFSIIAETERGESLTITDREEWFVEYSGFDQPDASLLTTPQYNTSGELFQASQLQARNIVLTFYLFKDIAQNRRLLYQYFKSGQYIKLSYISDNLDVFIEGYVESVNANQFENPNESKQVVQVSIMAFKPELIGTQIIKAEMSDGRIDFNNQSDVPAPFLLIFEALDQEAETEIINPMAYIFSDYEGMVGEIGVEYDIQGANQVYINTGMQALTSPYSPTNKFIDWRVGGIAMGSLLYERSEGSTWVFLPIGSGHIEVYAGASESNLKATLQYQQLYLGV